MSHIEPTAAVYEHSLRCADDIIETQRRELAVLRRLVTALAIPRIYSRADARGLRVVQCGFCGMYLYQWNVSQHLDTHIRLSREE